MAFRERFDSFVCEGDTIACTVDGLSVTARVVRDDCADAPDERQDGFWPSLHPEDPGFIGPGHDWRARFAAQQARAEAIMEAWRKDEWFYCGIVLSVARGGVTLDDYAASLWGIEANYPDSDNGYLSEIAANLLADAVTAGRDALRALCEGCGDAGAEVFA